MPDITMDEMREHRILRMLSDDPTMILLLRPMYVTDNMWKMAIEQEPGLFRFVKEPSEELCLFALKEDGGNLKYVVNNPNVKVTPEMCYVAVEDYPPAIFDVPSAMRDDPIKECAFDLDPTLMTHFSSIRKGYIEKKLKEDPTFCRFLDNPSEDLIYKAIESDPNYCVYIKEFTPRIVELIRNLYPDLLPLIGLMQRRKSGN